MGLLVAGITGGASLVKTAKLRSVITESETYRTAVNIYYSRFDKMPGLRDSATGLLDGDDMTPIAFWQDLKSANITDKTVITDSSNTVKDGVASKFKNAYWFVENVNAYYPANGIAKIATDESEGILSEFYELVFLYISGKYGVTVHPFVPNDAKNIDEKIDDGIYDTGYVRGVQAVRKNQNYNYGDPDHLDNYSIFIKLSF
jgi:hypothetical protein